MKTISGYEKEGYQGIDASLETSLFEYGLIWAQGLEGHEKDFHFIYGVEVKENECNEMEYSSFDWGDVAIDADPKKEWDFVNWGEVSSCVGMSIDDFLNQELPQIVFDLISYYGVENILGSSYYPFEVSEA